MSGVILRDPLLGSRELRGDKGGWVCCWGTKGYTVAKVLPVSRGLGAPGACSCAAKKSSYLQNALANHLVYPRINRPQSKSGLPAIYVERRQGHSQFCLEASYWCSLVGFSDSSEALVFGLLKLYSNNFSRD